jgi:hypothetical protein
MALFCMISAIALGARVTVDAKGKQSWSVEADELARLFLDGEEHGAREAVSIIRQGRVDVDGLLSFSLAQRRATTPTPLLIAAMQRYLMHDRPAAVLDVVDALLEAGASPNITAGGDSVLSLAITSLGVGAEGLWPPIIKRYPGAGLSLECATSGTHHAEVDARAECLPLIKLWASIAVERLSWVRTMSRAEGALRQTSFKQWVSRESRIFKLLRRSPTFTSWLKVVKRKTAKRASQTDWVGLAPKELRRLPFATLEKIAGEIFRSALGEMSMLPGFSWLQAVGAERWPSPPHLQANLEHRGGLLHILAYDGAVTALEALVDHVVELPEAATALFEGMRTADSSGRTPLHHLAMGFGSTALFEAWMRQVERLAFAAKAPWESTQVFLATLTQDHYQQQPADYVERKPVTALPALTPTSATETGLWPLSRSAADLEASPPGHCDLDTVIRDTNATEALFEEHLFSRRPLLIRGEGLDHVLRRRWARDVFVVKHGAEEVTVGEIPYGGDYGFQVQQMSMAEYVRVVEGISSAASNSGVPPYLFTTHEDLPSVAAEMKPSRAVMRRLSFASKRPTIIAQQFYLGPPGSGAPMHIHNDAANYLIYGRKRWFLSPPGDAEWSVQPASEFRDSLAGLASDQHAPIECVQQAGDMLYVPKGWGHSTINIEASVGVAYEFAHAAGLLNPVGRLSGRRGWRRRR